MKPRAGASWAQQPRSEPPPPCPGHTGDPSAATGLAAVHGCRPRRPPRRARDEIVDPGTGRKRDRLTNMQVGSICFANGAATPL